MTTKITQKITAYRVKTETNTVAPTETESALESIHEGMKRPDVLHGATYTIKPPDETRAMSVTINDMVLNEGTENEQKRPYEVFINSRSVDDAQWVMALTRITSAVFRKGGDIGFIADELKSVNDPSGGFFAKGKGYVPSLVSNVGMVLEDHFKLNGV
jgi:hypothetical protein